MGRLYTLGKTCYKPYFQWIGAHFRRMSVFGQGAARVCAVVATPSAQRISPDGAGGSAGNADGGVAAGLVGERSRAAKGSGMAKASSLRQRPFSWPPAGGAWEGGNLRVARRRNCSGYGRRRKPGACGAIWRLKRCENCRGKPWTDVNCRRRCCCQSMIFGGHRSDSEE